MSAEDQQAVAAIRAEIEDILSTYAPQPISEEDKAAIEDAHEQLEALREARDTSVVDDLKEQLHDLYREIGRAEPTDAQQASIDELKEQLDTASAPTAEEQVLLDQIASIREAYAPQQISEEDAARLDELHAELKELLPAHDAAEGGGPGGGGAPIHPGDILDHGPGDVLAQGGSRGGPGHGGGPDHGGMHGGPLDLHTLVTADTAAA